YATGSGCISGGTSDNHDQIVCHDIAIRNVEARDCAQGIIMANMSQVTIEDSAFHDSSQGGQHCVYLGARTLPASEITLRRNLCWNAGWNGFHLNGRIEHMQIEQNVVYSVGITGMSFQNGTSRSTIENNLLFNCAAAGLELSDYPGDCAQFGQGGTGEICPYD